MSQYDSHCQRPQCSCSHIICFRGWVDNDANRQTTPCDTCRPDTHRRWLRREQARAKGYPPEALQRIMTAKADA